MCGIAGFCARDPGAPADEALLRRATRALAHRGPDGDGFLLRGPVGLGHRRLSIIDVAGGGQPIFNEDGSVAVVFNGEIYDYLELRADLLGRGHRFLTGSDTEVIVHAYEEYGVDCLARFTGMFAFAIWDGRDGSVFVARDRLGKKPVFYHEGERGLAFASELKALLEDPALPRDVDPQAVDDYLAYGYVPSDRCILRAVRKLPPGHWMRWKDGCLVVRRYWEPHLEERPGVPEAEWAEQVEHELRRAVRLRLRADVPLGIFLSGGLDSSTITALASQELGGRVKTFSVSFREAAFDERPYARLVAERYGTDHHEITVEDRDIDVLGDIAYHLDEPFADPSALPTYYVCREAARHVKVCLAGDGADELLAGYTRYRLARRYERYDRLSGGVGAVLGSLAVQAMPVHWWGRGELERVAASGASRYLLQMAPFTYEERLALLGGRFAEVPRREPRLFAPYFAERRDLVSVLQHVDQNNYLPDDILVKVDRMSMQNSLEVRAPFLDHLLVELVNQLPVSLKLGSRGGKHILRRIMAAHLPAAVLERPKKGFGLPIKSWFRENLHDYARDWLLGPGSRSAAFLAREPVKRVLDQHARGMRDFSGRIWALLMLEHWGRRYGASSSS